MKKTNAHLQIEENSKAIEEIQADLCCSLMAIVEEFENKSETIENVIPLIDKCKPILANIKAVSGSSDILYLTISTDVARQVQDYLVREVNAVQENFEYKFKQIDKLKFTLKNAWAATLLLDTLDMEDDFKTNHYDRNKELLRELCRYSYVSTLSSAEKNKRAKTFARCIVVFLILAAGICYLIWGKEGLKAVASIACLIIILRIISSGQEFVNSRYK